MLKKLKIKKVTNEEKVKIRGGIISTCLGNCQNCQGSGSQEAESSFHDKGNASRC
jgi:hypothetical protein